MVKNPKYSSHFRLIWWHVCCVLCVCICVRLKMVSNFPIPICWMGAQFSICLDLRSLWKISISLKPLFLFNSTQQYHSSVYFHYYHEPSSIHSYAHVLSIKILMSRTKKTAASTKEYSSIELFQCPHSLAFWIFINASFSWSVKLFAYLNFKIIKIIVSSSKYPKSFNWNFLVVNDSFFVRMLWNE